MKLKYNDVNFEILSLDRVERNLTYSSDGTTVLWVDWNILASCVYAPAILDGTTDTFLGGTNVSRRPLANNQSRTLAAPTNPEHNDGAPPSSENREAGQNPRDERLYQNGLGHAIFSDQQILRRLAVPRKYLRLSAYLPNSNGDYSPLAPLTDVTWLESPRNGLPCDCNNGPIVKAVPISSTQGSAASFAVQLEIQTWVPPTDADRLVLSHRWQMELGRSPGDYLVRYVKGEVIFHAGMLRNQELNMSWFLSQFLHPIPPGFKRTLGPVACSPNGNVLRYEYQDEDQTVVFSPGKSGCTEVEVVVNGSFTVPTLRLRG